MTAYKSKTNINGFDYETMFASVNFSSDGETPLSIYENETEKVNEDDEICVIEKVYFDGQLKRTNVIDRDIDPEAFKIL